MQVKTSDEAKCDYIPPYTKITFQLLEYDSYGAITLAGTTTASSTDYDFNQGGFACLEVRVPPSQVAGRTGKTHPAHMSPSGCV